MHSQYGEINIKTLSSVGAYLRVRPYAIRMVEKWIHELQNKYDYVKINYYVIMPDHKY